jgi:hypothetical protein
VSGGSTTAIEALADQVVAQDVEAGRPGKDNGPWMDPRPEDGCCCCCWWVVVTFVCVVIAVIAGVVGYVTAESGGGTITPVPPAEAVPVTPQLPETTTSPANPTYNGAVQMVVQTTRNGQQSVFQVPAQLQLGGGSFTLSPSGIAPFTGTVGAGFAVSATGPGGALTGTLRDGTTQGLSLATTALPCPGACPVTVLLTSPLSLAPTVVQGPPLTGAIGGLVTLSGPPPNLGDGSRQVNWPLLAAGGAAGAVGLAIPLAQGIRRRRRSNPGPARPARGTR